MPLLSLNPVRAPEKRNFLPGMRKKILSSFPPSLCNGRCSQGQGEAAVVGGGGITPFNPPPCADTSSVFLGKTLHAGSAPEPGNYTYKYLGLFYQLKIL